jgi:uncharacterized protein
MSRIFWDTNLFIYLFEANGELSTRVASLRQSMLVRGDQLVTSAVTLGEILVKPFERGDDELARRYEQTITATSQVVSFDAKAAGVYARLRCNRSVRAPDAIQLACAAALGVDLFVTNDQRLQAMHVEGIQFIVSLERAPL